MKAIVDSLPESQIDIPIQIALRPFYALAEKKVDTVFTSPNYPKDWVQSDCATRYKYRFRRSPLRISASGTTMNLAFTGFYQITGSSRACVSGTVLSPWTPECGCGFKEGERRVNIGFGATFNLQPNYILKTKIVRPEPQALDKCSVCFWGQDITTTVLDGLKKELDASKKTMEDSFGTVNLRPYLQQAWNKLNAVYNIPGAGYFALHPKKLRMENIGAKNDLLNINIGISATPTVSLIRPDATTTTVPNLTTSGSPGGFNIFLEAALQYDSLSAVLNTYLMHKRFDISEGLIKNHIVIEDTKVAGDTSGNMVINLTFSGSFRGTVTFFGKPTYNAATKSIEVKDMDYNLQTKSVLLKTAKWLFSNRITDELKKYTTFSLASYYDTAKTTMNTWLNKEWMKGIKGSGAVSDLKLTNLYALPEHLLIRSNCVGKLAVQVSEIDLNF
ncbi:MAG: hypothetical protein JWP88_471 [Flaviaesturariibacter sp.]|nr:hypothetical protein [Flaviaesturariibacter sp.]